MKRNHSLQIILSSVLSLSLLLLIAFVPPVHAEPAGTSDGAPIISECCISPDHAGDVRTSFQSSAHTAGYQDGYYPHNYEYCSVNEPRPNEKNVTIHARVTFEPGSMKEGTYTYRARVYELMDLRGTTDSGSLIIDKEIVRQVTASSNSVFMLEVGSYDCDVDNYYRLELDVYYTGQDGVPVSVKNQDKSNNPTDYNGWNTFKVVIEDICSSSSGDSYPPIGGFTPPTLKGNPTIQTEVRIASVEGKSGTVSVDNGVKVFTPYLDKITPDGKIGGLTIRDKVTMKDYPVSSEDTYNPYTGANIEYQATGKIMKLGAGSTEEVFSKQHDLSFSYSNPVDYLNFAYWSNDTPITLEVGKTYVVYQNLELIKNDSPYSYEVEGSDLGVRTIKHEDPDAVSQTFRIADPRPGKDSIKIRTAVQRTEGTAVMSANASAALKIERDESAGSEVTVSGLEDVVTISGLVKNKPYTLTTTVYDKNGQLLYTKTSEVGGAEGDVVVSVSLSESSDKFKVGSFYYVSQKIESKEQMILRGENNRTVKEIHKGVHDGKSIKSQQFEIASKAVTPEQSKTNPSDPSGDGDTTGDPVSPTAPTSTEPTTASPTAATTPVSSSASQVTTAASTTVTPMAPSATTTASGATTSATTTAEVSSSSILQTAVSATESQTTTTTSAVVVTVTPVITAPVTTRTFEFVEIEEEIPLGIRTTAPIDLEQVLIDEEIPLGGVPYDSVTNVSQLPTTGMRLNEYYLGFGLLVTAVGTLLLKAAKQK